MVVHGRFGQAQALCFQSTKELQPEPKIQFDEDGCPEVRIALMIPSSTPFQSQRFFNSRTAVLWITLTLPWIVEAAVTSAIRTSDFLDSIGINSTFPDRGQPIERTAEMVNYLGIRWVRGGIEGLSADGPTTVQTYLLLHQKTGVRFSWGLGSGGTNLAYLIQTGRQLAKADALLAFEGNNEPNNWGVTYQGEKGGGGAPSWLAVAKMQRDLYAAVKGDALLKKYPVWSISENGAELDNVGIQFLTIPSSADTVMPPGTRYADSANVHNYIYHPNSSGLGDNKTWNASDPSAACRVDGLYGNYGRTWAKHFPGYGLDELAALPRVTTETGCTIGGAITGEIHALNLLSLYLDQFKRGWSHTSVYLLRDRQDEGGNQRFGFYTADYQPRNAAIYLHNLTSIVADKIPTPSKPGALDYVIPNEPEVVHDLLLQDSGGTFQLIVWGERLKGTDAIQVQLADTYNSVKVYDPTVGVEPVQTHHRVRSLSLSVSDHPLIVTIP